MKLRVFIVSLLLIIFATHPAHAIQNGRAVDGPTRVVPIYAMSKTNTLLQICSGFLYSKNIVFTAAHCIINDKFKANAIYVGQPGSTTHTGKITIAEKIFIHPEYVKVNHEEDLGAKNDFAIIKTKRQIVNIAVAKLAEPQTISNLKSLSAKVYVAGYGFTSESDRETRNFAKTKAAPKMATFFLTDKKAVAKSLDYVMNKFGRTYHPENLEYVTVLPDGPSLCDGDSGAGYYYKNIYLGISNWTINGSNCSSYSDINALIFGSFDPAYKFKEFISSTLDTISQ